MQTSIAILMKGSPWAPTQRAELLKYQESLALACLEVRTNLFHKS